MSVKEIRTRDFRFLVETIPKKRLPIPFFRLKAGKNGNLLKIQNRDFRGNSGRFGGTPTTRKKRKRLGNQALTQDRQGRV